MTNKPINQLNTMKNLILILSLITLGLNAKAQKMRIADSTGYRILEENKASFPKFYKILQEVLKNDPVIKNLGFIDRKGGSPGAAVIETGSILINVSTLMDKRPEWDDNRFVVILYHEIGHLHYGEKIPKEERNPIDNEKAAFEYSLIKTKELAEKGDCGPLKTGLHFMQQRSEGTNERDPHVKALKLMVTEPLYKGYVEYQKKKCK